MYYALVLLLCCLSSDITTTLVSAATEEEEATATVTTPTTNGDNTTVDVDFDTLFDEIVDARIRRLDVRGTSIVFYDAVSPVVLHMMACNSILVDFAPPSL